MQSKLEVVFLVIVKLVKLVKQLFSFSVVFEYGEKGIQIFFLLFYINDVKTSRLPLFCVGTQTCCFSDV